jgi:NTE family protein
VIKAFEEAGVRPDLIVGTSAGAFVGAFAAAGISAAQMEETALRVRDIEIVDFETGSRRGMVVGDSLQRFVNLAVRGRSIESLQTPFAAIATQLRTGEMAMLQRGDLGLAVRASCSVPGVFIPPKISDVEYVDGALVSPVPVRAARQLGAELVVAVDVGSATMNANPQGTYEQVMHAFDIMGRSLAGLESEQADVLIRPDTRSIPSTDFSARGVLISMGYSVGKKFAPVVTEKIAQMRARRS